MPFPLRRFPIPSSVWEILRPNYDEIDPGWIPVRIGWEKWVFLICKFLRRQQQKKHWRVLGDYCQTVKHLKPYSEKGIPKAVLRYRKILWGYSGPVTAVEIRWAKLMTKISIITRKRKTFANLGLLLSNREPEDLACGFDDSGRMGYFGCGVKFHYEGRPVHPCNYAKWPGSYIPGVPGSYIPGPPGSIFVDGTHL